MKDAIAKYIHDGTTVAIEGFTAFICFSAAHEIIRQKRRDLTLCRMTPDLIYDQMVAAGCARKLIFSYLGNPGVGPLYCIRRAIEKGIPNRLEIEEYSHFGTICRYMAGAARLPFFPLHSYLGDELPKMNSKIKYVKSPYDGKSIAVVPPLNPDVAIIHAQRADVMGNTQIWGLLGSQKEVAFASRHLIVVVEEIVDEAVIRRDPNRTVIPNLAVDAVVRQPFGAHPSYVQGYYDRDNDFYLKWSKLSRDEEKTRQWLDKWVYGVKDWNEYLAKLAMKQPDIWQRLSAGEAYSEPVNYGEYK
ncbi:MAG: 3-oxoadipate--succinyl-CoA transferase subunit A [Desulfobacteraceae bacterium 4572_123]|nr:MAG: 3-oxoadipate--succinyl-CoA transferase subunit A [Desulfobacteraceae bacterium 4572_123]